MYKKIYCFLSNIRLFEKKQTPKHHLIIIDGPPATAIAKQLVDHPESSDLRFMATVHYLALLDDIPPRLKTRMVGWQFSTLFTALFVFLGSLGKFSKGQTLHNKLTSTINQVGIEAYIRNNASLISSVIVFNERNAPPVFAVSVAKQHGLQTACIQHGAVVENYFPIHVDCYYTWSEYYSQLLQQRTPGLKAVPVGRLAYKITDHPAIEKKNGPLLVLQPANVSIEEAEIFSQFRTVIDICYQFYDEITLRPHPSDNILTDIIEYIGNRSYSIGSSDLGSALSGHQLTISLYSTVLYEAPLYDSIPVQYLEPHLSGELWNRCEFQASNPEQLHEILKRLQNKQDFNQYLERARSYSAKRMTFGDTTGFFDALRHT